MYIVLLVYIPLLTHLIKIIIYSQEMLSMLSANFGKHLRTHASRFYMFRQCAYVA
jgi:hypothetical protein